ncbi:MAG TPA: cytochrome C oxidase subunit IV family protein [Pirellulales bacterium]|jgi:cytochrome c oxidase subunit 4|nr:cytochrome C oxidase subunit IV family protein [Pirellulales bacterium]
MSEHQPHVTVKQYYGVFVALMVLLVVTILLAMVHLGALNTPVAMTVATIKTVLVMTYFMHLRYAARLVWLFAGAGAVWMAMLVGGTLNDYESRGWFTGRLGSVPVGEFQGVGTSEAIQLRSGSMPAAPGALDAAESVHREGRTKD